MDRKRRLVAVAGATGLIGSSLVRLLGERSDVSVIAVVREAKPGRFPANVEEVSFDYDSDASYLTLTERRPDVVFCCLGTTRAKAGSDAAFRRVDSEYPRRLVDAAKQAQATRDPGVERVVFGLVTSVGADSPRGLYLKTKAEAERALVESGLRYTIVRPSFLLGDRAEKRLGERVGIATLGPLLSAFGAISTSMKRYAPIQAIDVARALAHLCLDAHGADPIAEGTALFEAARAYGEPRLATS